MISASVGVNSSLLLEPAQTLTFALADSTSSARACLTLTNISARKHVVFKVRTTNVEMFMVKPAQGVIEPSGEVPIVITLLPAAGAKLLRMDVIERNALIERFLIQSIDRADDMRGFNLDDLTTFWKRIPKELITNKKLTCKFIEARDGDPVLHLPIHRIRLKSEEPIPEDDAASPYNQRQPQQYPPPRSPGVAIDNQFVRASPVQQARKTSSPSFPNHTSAQLQRTPPPVMNIPSSPVPSLRPKAVFAHSSSSNGSNNGDLGTGLSNASSHDSYATNNVPQQFDEHIQSDDVLEFKLHPSESLTFPVHRAYPHDSTTGIVEGKSYFFITNKARYSGLAYKIKTSNHSGYFVKPARGLIDPKSAQRVDVFVNAPDATQFNAHQRELKDRFLVELLFISAVDHGEISPMKEDRKRDELQRLWEGSKPADRRKAVLTCQILEEDAPIDPKHQTAEQARALLQKSQAAGFNNSGPIPRENSGETANPWIHRPPSPAYAGPGGPPGTRQNDPQDYQYQQQQYQPRSPVMQPRRDERSPVNQQPRSPVMQIRSPVRQPQQHLPYYGGPHRNQRVPYEDDSDGETYYA